MGMFDKFKFQDGILPNNKVPENYEFRTKCLECNLDTYLVDQNGNITVLEMWDGEDDMRPSDKVISDSAHVYSHEFMYQHADGEIKNFRKSVDDKYLGTKYQEYKIVIIKNKVMHVEKILEQGYE